LNIQILFIKKRKIPYRVRITAKREREQERVWIKSTNRNASITDIDKRNLLTHEWKRAIERKRQTSHVHRTSSGLINPLLLLSYLLINFKRNSLTFFSFSKYSCSLFNKHSISFIELSQLVRWLSLWNKNRNDVRVSNEMDAFE
jgi:hypothetical protein